MSGLISALVFFWLLGKLIQWLLSPWRKRRAERRKLGRVADYRLSPERNRALALAHPMAFHAMAGGFADRPMMPLDEGLTQLLPRRPLRFL